MIDRGWSGGEVGRDWESPMAVTFDDLNKPSIIVRDRQIQVSVTVEVSRRQSLGGSNRNL